MSVPLGLCSSPVIGDYGDDVAATRAALSFLPSKQVDAPKSQNLRPDTQKAAGSSRARAKALWFSS
jgi:hypothetical protein